jgi:hypothetical protein
VCITRVPAGPGVTIVGALLDDVIVRTRPASVAVPQCGQKRLPAGTGAWHWAQDTVAV